MSSTNHLLINSFDRNSGTSHDFGIQIPQIENLKSVRLLSASIPNSLYNVTNKNNKLDFFRGSNLQITVPPGAYSAEEFTNAIKFLMDNLDGVGIYTSSVNEITFKVMIECSLNFVLRTTQTTNSIFYILGYDSSADTASAMTHTANYAVSMHFPQYLLINIGQIGSSHSITSSNVRSNFVVSMTNNSSFVEIFNTNSNYENDTSYSHNSRLNYFNITLKKQNGESADLNGSDWSMLLALEFNNQ